MEEKECEDGAEINVKILATKMRVMQPQAKGAWAPSPSMGVALLTPTPAQAAACRPGPQQISGVLGHRSIAVCDGSHKTNSDFLLAFLLGTESFMPL